MDKLIRIGTIIGPHGRFGKMKSTCDIDSVLFERFVLGGDCYLEDGNSFLVKSVSFYGGKACIDNGFCNANDVAQYSGKAIMVQRSLLPDECLVLDINGLSVFIRKWLWFVRYGTVKDVHQHGCETFLEIVLTDNSDSNGNSNSEMYPFNDSHFPVVDLKNGIIVLRKN